MKKLTPNQIVIITMIVIILLGVLLIIGINSLSKITHKIIDKPPEDITVHIVTTSVETTTDETTEETSVTEEIITGQTSFEESLDQSMIEETSSSSQEITTSNPKIIENYVHLNMTEDDIYFLAKIIETEAGSDWISDYHQQCVGSVVINRVYSEEFPYDNSIYEVFYSGVGTSHQQYAPAGTSWFDNIVPSERALSNARYLAENGSVCPVGVIYQAEFVQGKIFECFSYGNDVTYICYG